MGPYELAAFYLLVPVMAGFVWMGRRFDTLGVRDRVFETWCREMRPAAFALHLESDLAPAVVARIADALRAPLLLEHHRGRSPWTRYAFALEIEITRENQAIVGRIVRCELRRESVKLPELGALLDAVVESLGAGVRATWVHAELREEDDLAGDDRPDRGWLTNREGESPEPSAVTRGLPGWALMSAPVTHPYRKAV